MARKTTASSKTTSPTVKAAAKKSETAAKKVSNTSKKSSAVKKSATAKKATPAKSTGSAKKAANTSKSANTTKTVSAKKSAAAKTTATKKTTSVSKTASTEKNTSTTTKTTGNKSASTKATAAKTTSATKKATSSKKPVAAKTAKSATKTKTIAKDTESKTSSTKTTNVQSKAKTTTRTAKKTEPKQDIDVNKTETMIDEEIALENSSELENAVDKLFENIDLTNLSPSTQLPKSKRGRPSAIEIEARKIAEERLLEAKKAQGITEEDIKKVQAAKKKIKGPGTQATTFKHVHLEGEALEKAKRAAEEAKNKDRTQTKEEQAKRKESFNDSRVEWFDAYMQGKAPNLLQLNISQNPEKLLSRKEQIKLAELIQSGIAATIIKAAIDEEHGKETPIRKTIEADKDSILDKLRLLGYTPKYFMENSRAMRKLNRLIEESEEGRKLFAVKNFKFVKMIAGKRKQNGLASYVDFDDLVAEGMSGLITAIDHYNPALGFKFATPAAWWVDQPIRSYLDSKTKTIHMPTHMNSIYKSIYYATRELQKEYANDDDITDELIAAKIQETGRNVTVEKIKEARLLRRETISYDNPINDDPDSKSLIDLIASSDNHEEEILSELSSKNTFNRMLSMIDDDKKREILRDWYSTDENQDIVILSNVSRKHCLTKERVRQLKSEAEEELRNKISAMAKAKGVSAKDVFYGNDVEMDLIEQEY